MTEMRRVTISLPDELDRKILEQKKRDEYVRDSYSEVCRKLLEKGLEKVGLGKDEVA